MLPDLLRYRRGEMTGKEKNSFERELQKDPFAEEAAEGFTSISPDESSKDLAYLQKQLKSRTIQRQRFVYYRIAASVAVLLVISSIFIMVEKNKPSKQLAETSGRTEALEITIDQPLTESAQKIEQTEEPVMISEKKAEKSAARQNRSETGRDAVPVDNVKIASAQIIDSVPEIKVKPVEEYIRDEKLAAPVATLIRAKTSSVFQTKGRVLSSEDNMPVPGASITIKGTNTGVVTDAGGNFNITLPDSGHRALVADFIGMESKEFMAGADSQQQVRLDPAISSLQEVVVVGYGVKRADYENDALPSGYSPPQPANGITNFDKYIQENIHTPDTTSGQRVVVVVSFLVHPNGSIDSIRIVRSPDKPFSDEAIRLIKSGPSWKPAVENGKIIEDEVRVRIVFR